jgi:zinc transport system substrate-binding protein
MRKITMVIVTLMLLLSGCSSKATSVKPKYAATILPLYDALNEIGQDKIEAVLIVPPGASPHTFTVTPEQIKALEGTKAIFKNDFGLEEWIGTIANNVSNSTVISVGDMFKQTVANHNGNPHIWLNPEFFVSESGVINDTLKENDPQNANFYESNFQNYKKGILDEAKKLKESLSTVQNKNIMTFHDAFPYFAEYFGLNIVGTVEQTPGKEPTPKEIVNLENIIRGKDVKVVFNEPQISQSLLNALVEDTGVKVLTLDPMENGDTGNTYIEVMDYNVNEILKGVK